MHICYDIRKIQIQTFDRPVITMGSFDGVHIGHRRILERVVEAARSAGRKSILVTYHPHPRTVLAPGTPFKLLTLLEEKIALMESLGMEEMVVLNFDQGLANTEARQFVDEILVGKLSPSRIIVGYDHGFGRKRLGGVELLQEAGNIHGFEVEVIQPVRINGQEISSSKIRKAFQAGNFNSGVNLLGHTYPLTGTVKMGTGLGRKLGYPTCNLVVAEEKLLPPQGIYSCRVRIDSDLKSGMAYIGSRPTVESTGELAVEVHILDFEGVLYDRAIRLELEEWVRPDRKFEKIDQLKIQIQQDERIIREKLKLT
ncbi:MAG: bifunctional riboflavin kinase/FAD synthetase [candidate division Zixibacteria bacterium]|nr:bifunctional riboflavin kinase/FAD synthetase [candidate division Zixibacteria bacterium]